MPAAPAPLPSVDEILRSTAGMAAVDAYGRAAATAAIRNALESERRRHFAGDSAPRADRASIAAEVTRLATAMLAASHRPTLRRVINLTGTVLHTNLGRALLADVAVEAAVSAMRHPAALELDLATGRRGERDDAVRGLVRELTGAEDAIVVNNNAAAVLLVLSALGKGRETIVSRGELIEIGGAFRMPDIMADAGTRLREVGTTNRTHLRDYAGAIGPETALLMKVHTSNYLITGFTKEVTASELKPLAVQHGLALVDDLGSGTLVDLAQYGLRRERTVRDAISDGVDIVTFSGDKLLGGPQAGFIAGRRDLVSHCARHPMKRAMRLDKIRLAALEATLALYRDPDRLRERLPALAALTRSEADLRTLADALLPVATAVLAPRYEVEVATCASQIGSGALPVETLPSAGLAIRPTGDVGGGGVEALAQTMRELPIPILGRIEKGALLLDLRALDDVTALREQLALLGKQVR